MELQKNNDDVSNWLSKHSSTAIFSLYIQYTKEA